MQFSRVTMPDSAVVTHVEPPVPSAFRRRLPVGAEVIAHGRTHVRVWAPLAERVDCVVLAQPEHRSTPLTRESDGYFSGVIDGKAGDRYQFRLNGEDRLYPDPVSRFQPEGPHGPSELVDARTFQWTDEGWRGVTLEGQVIYELHLGTFTRPGTWAAAAGELAELARLGITMIEVMPVAEFDGRFGWGYDGVDLFAPFGYRLAEDGLMRRSGTLGNPDFVGTFLAVAAPALLVGVVAGRRRIVRLGSALGLAGCVAAIVLSGFRGGVAALAVGLVSTCRASTRAPGTTAPDGSVTRPLMLA